MSKDKLSALAVYRQLWPYCRRYWGAFVLAIFANLAYAAINALFTYILKPILDNGFIGQNHQFLAWLPFIIIVMFFARGFFGLLGNLATARISQSVIMNIQRDVFAHMQKLPACYYDHNSSGHILSIMVYNVAQMANVSALAFVTFLQSFGMIIGLLLVMFSISWQLSLMYLVALPIIATVITYSSKHVRRISHKLQDTMKLVVATAQENLDGYREVRNFGATTHEADKFDNLVKCNRRNEMKNVLVRYSSVLLTQLVAGVVLAITAYFATSHSAIKMLSAGGFISMLAAMLAILKPMKDLTNVNNTIQRGVAGAEGVFDVLKMTPEKDGGKITAKNITGDLQFKNVSFAYNDEQDGVLNNISLHIPAGKIVALVGHSGAGKSTLVQLLPRYYQDYCGDITLDGTNIKDFSLASLRQQFSIVSQQVVLFNDNVKNNIAYGDFDNIDFARIKEAARLAHASEFIEKLPQGFDSFVGQDGVRLSGGQRQRLAIARAIYKDAPILILDEATSALDTESEKYIQQGLDELMKNRTTIVIAHRLSTIINADLIVVMDKGGIVESGQHEELLAKNGAYASLHQMQFEE